MSIAGFGSSSTMSTREQVQQRTAEQINPDFARFLRQYRQHVRVQKILQPLRLNLRWRECTSAPAHRNSTTGRRPFTPLWVALANLEITSTSRQGSGVFGSWPPLRCVSSLLSSIWTRRRGCWGALIDPMVKACVFRVLRASKMEEVD